MRQLIAATLALASLAACDRMSTTSHRLDLPDGTGGTATTVERIGPPPSRPRDMVSAPGRSSGKGSNP